ncbi:MAG: putative phosphatase/phosphohexomutase [Actinobacteria bacterium]|jgi:HAD superfamily hydrolase (TIGR01509 family)|nr:putative phosphatase/phosphohexomutase [Actinomycetota bacterium]
MYLHINKPYGTLLHVSSYQPRRFFEAVFFDMDGLFVDSEPIWLESESELTASFGYVWSDEDQVACLGGPLSRVGEYMFEKCNRVESPTFFTNTLIEIQTAKLRGKTPLLPGALELLLQLQSHGIATGLVSASPRNIVNAVLENLGGNPFPFSISADDVVNTKPHPDAYLLAAEKAGAEISRCLIFEDSLTGVSAAKASGAWLIAVPHLVVVPEEPRVRSIKSLTQISYDTLQELFKDFTTTI